MANRRDLHIGIDGDSRGFDRAFEDAEDAARGLDRELAKLERQQTAQERVSARAAVAVKRYGAEQDKAALSARKLGTEAKRAAEQAEQAQTRADAAAKAYERGLIDEAKALRAAARAEDATERAALKAAEAHRAAAHAADEQAQQERQLARDAALSAAAQRLAALKASGSIREHNALLGGLRNKYGDLSKTAVGGFEEITTLGQKAASGIEGLAQNVSVLGRSGPAALGLVAVALQLLPTLATAAGGAVALGLGGALALVAIKAQSSSADVQAAFAQLKSNVAGDLQEISKPFHATLLQVAADAQSAFESLEPALANAFAVMAPAISRFSREFAGSLSQLDPAIESIGRAFAAVLDTLGPQMGTIMHNIGTGIKAITDAVAANPEALANLVSGLSQIVRYVGDAIGLLIRYSDQINAVFKSFNIFAAGPIGWVTGLIFKAKDAFEGGHNAAKSFSESLMDIKPPAGTASAVSVQLAKDMTTLASSTSTAEDKTTALTDAFTRLLDPQLAAYQDTAKLNQGIVDLTDALAKSHGRLDDNSAAARGAKDAFAGLLGDAKAFAEDLLRSGDSLDTVQRKLAPYILSLYRAAGGNKQARALVDSFVRVLGLVPPKKSTTLYNNAAQQKKAIEAYQRQINALRGKRVDIYQVMHLTETQAYLNKRKNLLGYARGGLVHGYAAGGQVQSLAAGGPSGYVTGPGTTTSDSIMTRLSNKEFVVNAKATAANLPLLEAINSGGSMPVTAAAAMSGQSGGSSMPIDYDRLAGALVGAMRREGVGAAYLDGKAITDDVSRRIGRSADQRRRTG
jgi:ABC-type transporter Mla subunit MlaD